MSESLWAMRFGPSEPTPEESKRRVDRITKLLLEKTMGNFTVEVEAVGGHGCQREAKSGEVVKGCGQPGCPDCAARGFVKALQIHGNNVLRATLRHWPHTDTEVTDDLLTGKRRGNF